LIVNLTVTPPWRSEELDFLILTVSKVQDEEYSRRTRSEDPQKLSEFEAPEMEVIEKTYFKPFQSFNVDTSRTTPTSFWQVPQPRIRALTSQLTRRAVRQLQHSSWAWCWKEACSEPPRRGRLSTGRRTISPDFELKWPPDKSFAERIKHSICDRTDVRLISYSTRCVAIMSCLHFANVCLPYQNHEPILF
jgi:hypothetical protein